MDAKTYFDTKLPALLVKNPSKAGDLDAIFAFDISGDNGGQWTVDFKAKPATVKPGLHNAECTIQMESADFEAMMDNFSLAMQFFFTGKLKVEGDPMLATKLQSVFSE